MARPREIARRLCSASPRPSLEWLLRVPFPVKVFISYLAVVAAVAIPTWIYLADSFEERLLESFVDDAGRRVQLLAEELQDASEDERITRLRTLAPLFPERLTYIAEDGTVGFDSSTDERLENHGDRPEVLQAIGEVRSKRAARLDEEKLGVAWRTSRTTGIDTLYVAARVAPRQGNAVIRLATPVARVESLSDPLIAAFRNYVAIAISLAIVLSLVAAVVFARPLRRLAEISRSISEGHYRQTLPELGGAEIGDVADAIRRMLRDIRERMAVAETASSMLSELVEALPNPVVVLDADDKPLATNAAARRLLNQHAATSEQALLGLLAPEHFRSAVGEAHETGLPQRVILAENDDEPLPMWVYPVPHPSGSPLTLLVRDAPPELQPSALPSPADVVANDAADVVKTGHELAGAPVPNLDSLDSIKVADAFGRSALAIAQILRAAPSAPLRIETTDRAVELSLAAGIADSELRLAGAMLEPLGGRVRGDGTSTHIRLAVA